jgi:perosamine synthetase
MFAMRFKPKHCGGISLQRFLELVQAEGAPIYRAFAATMSEQPAMQYLIRKRPDYFRRLPTPIADRAAEETVYIAHSVFLGTAEDMEDIAAAVRKVQRHCLEQERRGIRRAA